MEELLVFLSIYGWQLALIALAGIVILGVLKYANVFSKVEKEKRKIIYLAITVGLSIIGSMIYLAIIGQFSLEYIMAITTAIYALNQAFYTIYESTPLRELLVKLLDFIKAQIQKNKDKNK